MIKDIYRRVVLYSFIIFVVFFVFTLFREAPEHIVARQASDLSTQPQTDNTHAPDFFSEPMSLTTVTDTIAHGIRNLPLCSSKPKGSNITVNNTIPESIDHITSVMKSSPPVALGGRWRPDGCESRSRLAVVMSYRNRTDNLKRILQHLHYFLQQQLIEYQMFVIEPEEGDIFNRGILKNIGFVEAIKARNFSCVVFHDIDLAPENLLNSYHCPNMPRHLVVAIDTRNYKPLAYGALFGGAVLFRSEHFRLVNGYSNLYFDWGAEDDDLKYRVGANKLRVRRPPKKYGRYTEFVHKKDAKRPRINKKLYHRRVGREKTDGLSSLQYTVRDIHTYSAYTWILVHYTKQDYQEQIDRAMNIKH